MTKRVMVLANDDIGLYKFRKELIKKMQDYGWHVMIALPYGDMIRPLQESGCEFIEIPVDRRGINPAKDMGLIRTYRKLIKRKKPDLVITYTIKPNIYGGIVCRLFKVPYAMNITGLGTAFQKDGMVKKLVIFLYKIACKKVKVVFFENKGNQEVFIKHNILKREQTYALPGAGVNLQDFPMTEYPKDDKEIHFIFIGRVMKEKGMDEFFYAAKKLKKKYPQVHFHVVGPFEENYKTTIGDLELKEVISYHGFQADVRPFIKMSHCFVLPSYHEGMANTLLEAGAMGRPLITSRIHGCMEAVKEEKNGYLVKVKNRKELLQKMEDFVLLAYEEKVKMGQASRKLMKEKFDKGNVVEMTVKRLGE